MSIAASGKKSTHSQLTKQALCQRLRIQYLSARNVEPYEEERTCGVMVYMLHRKGALDRFVAKRRRRA